MIQLYGTPPQKYHTSKLALETGAELLKFKIHDGGYMKFRELYVFKPPKMTN